MLNITVNQELLNKSNIEDTIAVAFNDKGVGFELFMKSKEKYELYQLSGNPECNETIDKLESNFYRNYSGEVTVENIAAYMASLLG
ncbi:hypothetical protein [Lacrimispora amygdalina]|uniref:hypothetical protein n=1 Tax=Lacrimispora amygdalina TaxID=253257 RepID=UPI000BE31E80|nr:hypothetical protein [Lacrimispora amygdalina]